MCDQLYRLDAQIGAFLAFLDGLGTRVLVVMTGDHGGSDFVERLALRGFANVRRIDSKVLLKAVNDELKTKFSLTADPLITPDFTQFYAVDDKKRALGEPLRTTVIEAALAIINARPEEEEAFSLKGSSQPQSEAKRPVRLFSARPLRPERDGWSVGRHHCCFQVWDCDRAGLADGFSHGA
jgi:hypothetical protein